MFRLDDAKFLSDPYPIGLATNVFEWWFYQHMLNQYPTEKLFGQLSGGYKKWSLSKVNHPAEYSQVINSVPVWRTVHCYLTDPWFVADVFRSLALHGVSIDGFEVEPPGPGAPWSTAGWDPKRYKTRWEFSSLPTDGGFILPHTDIPSKVVTLIVPLTENEEKGCGTMVLRKKYSERPYEDYRAPLEDFEMAHEFPFQPNCAVLFVKSADSWHAVGPLHGEPGGWRRSLTINIERVKA